MMVIINFLFTEGSQSSAAAVSKLVTTSLMPDPYFKWKYSALGAISIMKKYKTWSLSSGSLQCTQRHYELKGNIHVLVQDNKRCQS